MYCFQCFFLFLGSVDYVADFTAVDTCSFFVPQELKIFFIVSNEGK